MLFYFVQLRSEQSISDSPEVKAEYLSCLRRLHLLINNGNTSKVGEEKEMQDEIRRVEGEISDAVKSWSYKLRFWSQEEAVDLVETQPLVFVLINNCWIPKDLGNRESHIFLLLHILFNKNSVTLVQSKIVYMP